MKKLILFFLGFMFILPIALQAQFLQDCKHPCEKTKVVKYGAFIGVKISDIPSSKYVFVMDVLPNTAAYVFGIKPMDIITHINEIEMQNTIHLLSEVAKKQPGQDVNVTIQRGGRRMNFEFPLGAQFTKLVTEMVCCDDTIASNTIDILLSPIPARDILNISINEHISDDVKFCIVNSNGDLLLSEARKVNSGNLQSKLDIRSLKPGSYLLKIKIGDQQYVKRFGKE